MRGAKHSLPQYVFRTWCLIKQEIFFVALCLVKHRDKVTFIF